MNSELIFKVGAGEKLKSESSRVLCFFADRPRAGISNDSILHGKLVCASPYWFNLEHVSLVVARYTRLLCGWWGVITFSLV